MSQQLYIPKKIKVGYQKRDDTYSKKLAYIIYYDDKGKLRKETSWESWRDKKIEAEEYENKPQSGFVLHKDIKRYNWSHFSSRRTMIRIYDPRGIEFEITTENLIGILMHDDCSKRGLQSDYVYAWSGPELVLLPTVSDEYQNATKYTELQGQKVSAKTLVPGVSYRSKKEKDYIYIGYFYWYKLDGPYYSKENDDRLGKKYHIFWSIDRKDFEPKSSMDFLACANSEEIVSNYAELVDNFKKDIRSSKIIDFEFKQVKFDATEVKEKYSDRNTLKNPNYFIKNGDVINLATVYMDHNYNSSERKNEFVGYHYDYCRGFDTKTQKFCASNSRWGSETVYKNGKIDSNRWYGYTHVHFTKEDMEKIEFYKVYAILENGHKFQLTSFNQI